MRSTSVAALPVQTTDRLFPHFLLVCVVALAAFVLGCSGVPNGSSAADASGAGTGDVKPGPVDDDAPEKFTTTESGLKYRIRRQAEGPKPKRTSTVQVHYKGWLDDGTVFDSSYDRGEPIEFSLAGVIPGWTEGLQKVNRGGMIELEIPPELGYGRQGAGGVIPPNATLHFLVELLEVK